MFCDLMHDITAQNLKKLKKNYLTESAGFENMRFTFCTKPVDDIQVYLDFVLEIQMVYLVSRRALFLLQLRPKTNLFYVNFYYYFTFFGCLIWLFVDHCMHLFH